MRRIPPVLTVVLLISSTVAALTLPEGGLPAGRMAITPVVAARESSLGTANLLQNFLGGAGSSLPGAAEISTLDAASARYAAGAMLGSVPPALWADVMMGKDLDPAERGRIVAAFAVYLGQAADSAGKGNGDVL